MNLHCNPFYKAKKNNTNNNYQYMHMRYKYGKSAYSIRLVFTYARLGLNGSTSDE